MIAVCYSRFRHSSGTNLDEYYRIHTSTTMDPHGVYHCVSGMLEVEC